jgi:hypothetical protein
MMNAPPLWVTDIETKAGGKPGVLVQGQDDFVLLGHFLSQHTAGWDQQLYLTATGTKQQVIKGIETHHPEWVGIVDLDEWAMTSQN